MTNHTDFTSWIETQAGYAYHNGVRKVVKAVYFVDDSNNKKVSDIVCIKFADGTTSVNFKDVDFVELRYRFKEQKNK